VTLSGGIFTRIMLPFSELPSLGADLAPLAACKEMSNTGGHGHGAGCHAAES
jgi:hypothetical protein